MRQIGNRTVAIISWYNSYGHNTWLAHSCWLHFIFLLTLLHLLLHSLCFFLAQHHKGPPPCLLPDHNADCQVDNVEVVAEKVPTHPLHPWLHPPRHCAKANPSNITQGKKGTRSSICIWKACELHYRSLKGACISSNALSKSLPTVLSSRPIGSKALKLMTLWKGKGQNWKPRSLMGFGCPGMMQSGPAGSRKHSRASPYPIGSGCFMMLMA